MDIKSVNAEQLEELYLNLTFPTSPSDRPYVYINMVASFDGVINVKDPQTGIASEKGLGSEVDKRVMQLLRTHADATLNGAATLRLSGSGSYINDENLRNKRAQANKSPNPIAAVLSYVGDNLPLDKNDPHSNFFYSTKYERILFLANAASDQVIAKVKATGTKVELISTEKDNVVQLVQILKEKYNANYLLCEGGPSINGSLLNNNLVDEFFMTLSPKIVGAGLHPVEMKEPLTFGDLVDLKPISNFFLEETGESFLRYKVKRETDSQG